MVTNKLFDLKDFVYFSDTFIETGCAMGDGVQRAIDAGFKMVKSIEAKEKYFKISYVRFMHNYNVKICPGLSVNWLDALIQKPSVIFLDAHPAGEGSFNHEEWIATKENFQHNTILAELEIILKSGKHLIIIDDMNGVDEVSQQYIKLIGDDYEFYFYDQDMGKFYKDKILVAVP